MTQELTQENLQKFNDDVRRLWNDRFGEISVTDGAEQFVNKSQAKLAVLTGEALCVAWGLTGGDLGSATSAVGRAMAKIISNNPKEFGNPRITHPAGRA